MSKCELSTIEKHLPTYYVIINSSHIWRETVRFLSCKKALKFVIRFVSLYLNLPQKMTPMIPSHCLKKKLPKRQKETRSISDYLWKWPLMIKSFGHFKMCWKQMSRVGPLLTLKSLSQKWNTTMEHPFAVFLHEYFTL